MTVQSSWPENPTHSDSLERVTEGASRASHPTPLPWADFKCMTTKLQLKGTWNEVKGRLKQKYAELTDDDLTFVEGKEDEMLGRLQQRLGRSKEEVRNMVQDM